MRRFDLTMFLYVYCPTGSRRLLSSLPRHRMPAWLRLSLNFCMRLSFIFKVSQHFLKSQSLNYLMFIFCLVHLALFLNFIGLNYAISAILFFCFALSALSALSPTKVQIVQIVQCIFFSNAMFKN